MADGNIELLDAQHMADSLSNALSGVGTSRDRGGLTQYVDRDLTPTEIQNAYDNDWMASKAIDAPAEDMFKAWRSWQAGEKQIEAIEEEERRFYLQGKMTEVVKQARKSGGAALVMIVGNDAPEEELRIDRVGKGDLRNVIVLSKYEISYDEKRRDPEDYWYGQPNLYHLSKPSGEVMHIHPSRVVPFIGKDPLKGNTHADFWGHSILKVMQEALKNASTACQVIASLLHEAKIDVIGIDGLTELLSSTEGELLFQRRFNTVLTSKSVTNAVVIDKQDTYEQKQINFSTFPELIREYAQHVSGASDVPMTRFFGTSPGGLNSTGEGDLDNYYDALASDLVVKIDPKIRLLNEVIIRSATGSRDKSIHYNWNPLKQMDAKELAEIEEKKSKTYVNLSGLGLVPDRVLSSTLRNDMIESPAFSGAEKAFEEYGEEAEAFDPEAGNPNNPDEIEPEA